jgi:hypothetical protein
MNRALYDSNTAASPARTKPSFALSEGEGVDDIYRTTATPEFLKRKKARGDVISLRRRSVEKLRTSLGSLFKENHQLQQDQQLEVKSNEFQLRDMLSQKCEESRKSFASAANRTSERSFDLSSLNYLFEDDDRSNHEEEGSPGIRLSLFGTDVEEQQRLLDSFSTEQSDPPRLLGSFSTTQSDSSRTMESNPEASAHRGAITHEEEDKKPVLPDMIEVTPRLILPLRNSVETFQAIMEGRVMVTQCCNCSSELTVVEDAGLVLCSDCFVFSPVDQNISSLSVEQMNLHKSRDSVGIGIRPNEILEWLASQEEGQH